MMSSPNYLIIPEEFRDKLDSNSNHFEDIMYCIINHLHTYF